MKLLCLFLTLLLSLNSTAQDIWLGNIENKVITGPALKNRDLSFGIKNILEELLQDRGYSLDPNSLNVLSIEIVYFDVQKTSMQLGAYGKYLDVTESIFRATRIQDGKKVNDVVVKGQAKSISTSTLIIHQGGKFSQSNVSIALKKVCEDVLTKFEL